MINSVGNDKNTEYSSEFEFECDVGSMMAGVALNGDFVRTLLAK